MRRKKIIKDGVILIIKELKISYFRNYKDQNIIFSPGLIVINGDNGQGKSNMLEAIYNLFFARSFRGSKDGDMVSWGNPYYFLQGTVYIQKRLYKLEVGYEVKRKRKVISINGKKGYSVPFTWPVVFFMPEDLELVRRGPEERRRFIDRELSQVNSFYANCLQKYRKALIQKNKLLKEKGCFDKSIKEQLNPWNKQLIYFGSRIIFLRAQHLSIWSELSSKNFKKLFTQDKELQLEYSTIYSDKGIYSNSVEEIEAILEKTLEKYLKEEIKRGFSMIGPHRDDFSFFLEGKEAKRFASHGQQRSAVVALKAAQIQFFSAKGEKPLLMVDDVFSELDESRKENCFSLFNEAEQIFLTSTDITKLPRMFFEKAINYISLVVEEGKVKEISGYGKN